MSLLWPGVVQLSRNRARLLSSFELPARVFIEPETRRKSGSHPHKIAIVTPARIESLLHAASRLTDATGGVLRGLFPRIREQGNRYLSRFV